MQLLPRSLCCYGFLMLGALSNILPQFGQHALSSITFFIGGLPLHSFLQCGQMYCISSPPLLGLVDLSNNFQSA